MHEGPAPGRKPAGRRPHAGWYVVVPQKDLRTAKSRIDLEPSARRRLAVAMLADTVAAAREATGVEHVMVVCEIDEDADALAELDVTIHIEPSHGGLNGAAESGAARARAIRPACDVAVLPGDLPGLRPADLTRALALAGRNARSFVADAAGIGTTMVAATAGRDLGAAYGRSSRLAHVRSGAVQLGGPDELASLRRDVDDLGSLTAIVADGCGPRTRRFYAELCGGRRA